VEEGASKELTSFQRFKQKVSVIRASFVAKAEEHPRIAVGMIVSIVALALWSVRSQITKFTGLHRFEEKIPVNDRQTAVDDSGVSDKGDSSGSAPDTDGTNANPGVPPTPLNAENLGKQKTGKTSFISLMHKLMPEKINWNVAGPAGVALVMVLLASKVDAFKFDSGAIYSSPLNAADAARLARLVTPTAPKLIDPSDRRQEASCFKTGKVIKNLDGSFTHMYAFDMGKIDLSAPGATDVEEMCTRFSLRMNTKARNASARGQAASRFQAGEVIKNPDGSSTHMYAIVSDNPPLLSENKS
jgi:hypothetical protein